MILPQELIKAIDPLLEYRRSISLYTQDGIFRPIYEVDFCNKPCVLKLSNYSINDERKHHTREVIGLNSANRVFGVTQLVRYYGELDLSIGKFGVILKEYFPGFDLTKVKSLSEELKQKLRTTLSQLHERGVVHLDIWPQNVVTSYDSSDLKIIDLGKCFVINEPGKRLLRLKQRDFVNLECLLNRF